MKLKNIMLSLSLCLTPLVITSCNNLTPEQEEFNTNTKSLYEEAKLHGYEGTYEEWINSIKGEVGDEGAKIKNIIEKEIKDNKITYLVTLSNNKYYEISLNLPKKGISVLSVTKLKTEGIIDVYKITYDNNEESTFIITNGKDGEKGIQGIKGPDGKTPKVTISEDGYWIIDDVKLDIKANGIKGEDGDKGDKGEVGDIGKSAYEVYLETYPNEKDLYPNEKVWIEALIKGELGTKKKHVITFDSNGGTSLDPVLVTHGEKITKPKDPIKEGYNFLGWYYQDERWSFIGLPVTEDMTLVAKWEIKTYVITINSNNGEDIIEKKCEHNDNVYLNKPTKEGYEFLKWVDELGRTIVSPFKATRDITISAVFSKEITLNFNSDGGSTLYSLIIRTKVPIGVLPTSIKEGYEFEGWYLDNGKYDTLINESTIFENETDINLIAKWKDISLDYKYQKLSDGTYEILGYSGDKTKLVVPTKFSFGDISSIGDNAFKNNSILTEITLNKNIKHIGKSAFEGSKNLLKVTIDSDIDSLNENTFNSSENLSLIILPKTLKVVKNGAFNGCVSLDNVFYYGTQNEWLLIDIELNNSPLNKANIVFDFKGIIQTDKIRNIVFDSTGNKYSPTLNTTTANIYTGMTHVFGLLVYKSLSNTYIGVKLPYDAKATIVGDNLGVSLRLNKNTNEMIVDATNCSYTGDIKVEITTEFYDPYWVEKPIEFTFHIVRGLTPQNIEGEWGALESSYNGSTIVFTENKWAPSYPGYDNSRPYQGSIFVDGKTYEFAYNYDPLTYKFNAELVTPKFLSSYLYIEYDLSTNLIGVALKVNSMDGDTTKQENILGFQDGDDLEYTYFNKIN